MCGIAGFNWHDEGLIKGMAELMKHRGPDDSGVYVNDNVSLGHRRLSILDISRRGRQPMHFKNLSIVYNGELYNFMELKEHLKSKELPSASRASTGAW